VRCKSWAVTLKGRGDDRNKGVHFLQRWDAGYLLRAAVHPGLGTALLPGGSGELEGRGQGRLFEQGAVEAFDPAVLHQSPSGRSVA
jgi:hypothetical protein